MKIGIIGTNFISEAMITAAKATNRYEFEVVCSRNLSNAKDFRDKHGIHAYTDNYKDFLQHDLDAVYIAVPNVLHYEIALFFLEHKIAVLCEKPLASNLKEVQSLIESSHRNRTLLMEGVIPMYTKAFDVLQKSIQNIGAVRGAVLAMNQYSSRYDAFREGEVLNAFKRELSNGSTLDIAVYPVTLAVRLFGKPNEISASAYLLSTGVDGKGSILLHYDEMDVIITHSKISNQILKPEIQGEDAILNFDHMNYMKKIEITKNKEETKVIFEDNEDLSMIYELNAFADAFKNKEIEVFEGAHQVSLDTHEILTEARRQTNIVFPADK